MVVTVPLCLLFSKYLIICRLQGLGGGCYCVTLPKFKKMPNNLQTTGLGGGCYCVTLLNVLKMPNNLQATRLVVGGCCGTLLYP